MSANPLFSVLIANYNNGKYLMDAIESVRRQTYQNWEIILVDDGSTDESKELYKELEKDERIHIYLNDKNHGCGYTKHRCVELANGELCGFLDPDDTLEPIALEKESEIHIHYPQVVIVYSKVKFCDSDKNVLFYGELPQIMDNQTFFDYRWHGAVNFASFKMSYYKETEGINPRIKAAVDHDLYFKLEEVGEFYLLDEYTYNYVVTGNPNAITQSENNIARLWYWNLKVRYDACIRRGLNADEIIQSDLQVVLDKYANIKIGEVEKKIRNSKSYRIGKVILNPFKLIKDLLCKR